MWFLPDFTSSLEDGVHTILRFADGFRRAHGVESRFCVVGRTPPAVLQSHVSSAFPGLAAQSSFFSVKAWDRVAGLPSADAAVCTSWLTAYAAREFQQAASKFYFLQDDEALFYPAGALSALAEATYRFGYYGICNSVSVWNAYTARGGEGAYITPCIDPEVFHADPRRDAEGMPHLLYVHGDPGLPGSGFELVSAAIRLAKQRMGDRLIAVGAGADWAPRDHGLDGIVHNLGMLGPQSAAAVYRSCDIGVSITTTRHPSYLPLELMACGTLVIANRNPDTAWLFEDRVNCLLSGFTPGEFAARIEEACEDSSLRRRITSQAVQLVHSYYSQWDWEIEKTYQSMLAAL